MISHCCFGQFDGEQGQHEAYHRHCGNQISPDVEGVGAGGGHVEAAHITITIPARVKKPGRRRRTAVTVQNMTATTKAVDNALNR